MTSQAILEAHNRRLRELDPLLPAAQPLPAPGPDDIPIDCPGGSGLARLTRVDLDSFAATWSAAEEHRLLARAADVGAMPDLLAQWDRTVRDRATAGEPDSEAMLSWPSRDTAAVPTFRAHGLMAQVTVAVRPAGRPSPIAAAEDGRPTGRWLAIERPPEGGSNQSVTAVRTLRAADVDAATRLWSAEVAWDQQFGGPTVRESTEGNIRDRLVTAATADEPWCWVAEQGGRPVGLAVLSPPPAADWISPLVAAKPVAYVDNLVVADGHRGTGIGTTLMQRVHVELDRSGVAVTLLHYATMNPLSGPFWHRWGYRPLWTLWARRPAWPRLVARDG